MQEKNIKSLAIHEVNTFLDCTLADFIGQNDKYLGQLVLIKGRLVNVEQALTNSKYSVVYDLILEDESSRIEVEASKTMLQNFKNGSFVEVIGQPKFNFYKNECKKRFKATAVNISQDQQKAHQIKTELENFDKLKNFRPNSIAFPNTNKLKVAVIYSSATAVQIQDDFFKPLNQYLSICEFTRLTVSLSDVIALSEKIKQASHCDVVVLIRGGGNAESFKIFNHENVLNAFSKLNAYRIVGLGHNTDITLLDYIADHSAFTPSDAGLHLSQQIQLMLERNKKLNELESKVVHLNREISDKHKSIKNLEFEKAKLPERSEVEKLRHDNAMLSSQLNLEQEKPNKNNSFIAFVALASIIIGFVFAKIV